MKGARRSHRPSEKESRLNIYCVHGASQGPSKTRIQVEFSLLELDFPIN